MEKRKLLNLTSLRAPKLDDPINKAPRDNTKHNKSLIVSINQGLENKLA